MSRTVAWFSCGAASAMAARIAMENNPDTIVARIVLDTEHPDNGRFAGDVAEWLGVKIVELRSSRYTDTWDVWERRRYLNGPAGALCTTELKKKVRQEFEDLLDTQVFGYVAGEEKRAERFRQNNPEVTCSFPLIEGGYTKDDCFRILTNSGLVLPAPYSMGYHNANCIPCVKGGKGYWNKIRRDYPDAFYRMSALEERIGASCINGQPLRTLDPEAGRHEDLELPDCGLFCGENGSSQEAA
jgi:hypothetical protein